MSILDAIMGTQTLPQATQMNPTAGGLQQQGNRVVEMIRKATQANQPSLGDELQRDPAQNSQFYQNLAKISMGSAPTQGIYQAGQSAIDDSRTRRADIAKQDLTAETDVYNTMQQLKAQGDAEATKIDQTIESLVGNDPAKKKAMYDELHKDPDELDSTNIATKATNAAARLGLYNEFERVDMDYKKAMAEAALARQGINAKAPQGYRFTSDGTALEPIPGGPEEKTISKAENLKQDMIKVAKNLLANESGVRANRGSISNIFPNVSDSSVNAAADLETLKSMLTVDNLGLLKGVLSDTDMRVLSMIGAGGLEGSDEKTLQGIKDIIFKLGGKMPDGVESNIAGNGGGFTAGKIGNIDGYIIEEVE